MAFRYEVNGQIVEFDNEPTEQDIDEAAGQLGQPQAQPSGFDKFMTNMARPGASVRERLRGIQETGDIKESNRRADEAWKNPASSETFDVEAGRKANEAMDKSWVSKLPEGPQTAVRYAGSILPRELGFIKNTILDPVQMGIGVLTDGILRGLGKVPFKGVTLGERASKIPLNDGLKPQPQNLFASEEGMAAKSSELALKARDKTMKLFPKNLQEGSLEQRRSTAEQSSKYIQKSKNYEDISNQMEMAKGITGGELDKVYAANSSSNARSQHDQLLKYISDLEKSSLGKTQSGKNTIKKLRDLHTADVDTLNAQSPESLNDPTFYQKQKEMFQAEANRLGAYDDPESGAMAEGLKRISRGYQDKVYAVDSSVKPILNEQSGLIKSQKMAEEMAINEAHDLKPSVVQEAAGSISGSPVQTSARFVRKGILDRLIGSDAKRLTDPRFGKGIPQLMEESKKAQSLSDLIAQMKKPEKVTFSMDEPKKLSAPPQKQLPSPDDFRTRDIKAGKFLSGGQGGGKTIKLGDRGRFGSGEISLGDTPDYPRTGNLPATGQEGLKPRRPSQINMPEYTASDMAALAKKYGVSERNVREVIKAIDIEPVVKSSSTEGLVMSKKRRNTLSELAKRRKANFGG